MEGSAQMGHSITSVHQISGLEERAGDNIERMLGIKDSTSFCGSWLRRDTWVGLGFEVVCLILLGCSTFSFAFCFSGNDFIH